MTERHIAILGMVAGILIALGSLLPWASVTTGFGTASINGTDGDGILTLGLGVVIALASFGRYAGSVLPWVRFAIALLGGLTVFFAGQDAFAIAKPASVGIGLIVVILGGVLAVLAGAKGKAEVAAAAPPPAGPAWGTPTPPAAVDAQPAATPSDPTAALTNLTAMRDRGLITAEEFEAKKTELLARL